MWKVLVVLVCVGAVVYCDDSSKDDVSDSETSIKGVSSTSSRSSTSTTAFANSSSSSKSGSSSQPSSSKYKEYTKYKKIQKYDGSSSDDDIAESQVESSRGLPRPRPYKCGRNQVFSNCTNGGCDARNCSQAGKPVPCVKLDPKSCKKGCICKEGYLRAANGTCVLRNQCDEGCGDDPNAHPGCGVNCGRTCSTYKQDNVACILICNLNGCDCNKGYVYDPNVKKCVLPKQCTPTCGLNEVYSTCTNGGCSRRYCSQHGKPQICIQRTPESCIKGCVCADGYLRNANGTCVLENQCPQTGCGGDPNAQPGCGFNCHKKCSDYKSTNRFLCPRIQCKPDKCDCKDGYVLDQNVKKCVLPEQCTPICGLNEQYSSCTNGGCGHRNCSQVGKPQICIDRTPESCIKGCICADGYLRAANGTCVPVDQCPTTGCGGDPNAHSGCGVNCGRTCDTYNSKGPIACPAICNLNGCDCNEGYVFDGKVGKCVLPKDCTPKCGRNEKISSCINGGCGYQNCSQIGKPKLCRDPIPGRCIKGCVCADGYLRADNGTCVPEDQCSVSGCGGDPNAHPGCGVNCGKTCETYKATKPIACPLICKLNGCDCNDGYVFDSSVNKCVLPKDCTPECGLNEVVSSCINGYCGHRNCSQIGQPILCVDPPPNGCIKGCVCANGYLRADNGTCVPEKECPATGCGGDPNAKPGCGVNCGKTCVPGPCPKICKVGGCDCIDGYVYDNNVKKCVLPEECTPNCKNKPNEVFDVCPAPCPPRRCDVDDRVIRCAAPPKPGDAACKPDCRCIDGYARLANGTCVLREQCEKPLDCDYEANEIYDSCPGVCPGQSCDVDPALVLCEPNPVYGDPRCKPACRCFDGYVRDADNKCIPRDQCPPKGDDQCPGQNEFYDTCISGCGNQSCDSIGKVINCPIMPAVCREGCRCKSGFYRNSDNVCVPESECPPKSDDRCPGQNEFYDTCISGCGNQSCDSIGKVIHCPIMPAVCREGCRCRTGYYRNANNVCVPESECTTSNQCKGQNEYLDMCISGCGNQTCDSIGKIYNCPIQPAICRIGCRCNSGFYRNASNVCVPESQCPTPTCPDGEVWSRCPTVKCEGDYCPKDRNSPQTCPVGIVCDPPRCTCGLLDKRDRKTGKCIKAYACPPFKCDGPNESYDSCPAGCPGEKCSDYISGSKCPPFRIGIVVPCRPACKCNKGYYRNSNGICIPASECGPVNTTTSTPVSIETTTTPKPTTGSSDDGVASLKTGITNFDGKFLYNRMKAGKGTNIIASPYSVFTPLVQLALYATGEALKQLLAVLNLSSKEQIRSAFPVLVASFEGQTSVNFSTAAKVYSDIKYPLSDGFKKDSVDIVHAEAQELDFSKNTEAANIINAWVESKTNNLIHDLIQPDDLSSLTRLVLVNAIYFKGEWKYAFNKNNTIKDADFYLSDGTTKKTKLMFQEGQFNYGSVPDLSCTVLEMFYKGEEFSMVFILPNEKDGVLPLAEKLQEQKNFDKVVGSTSRQKVKVYVPPFTIETTTDLGDILKQIGVTKIFDSNDSGLSGLLKTKEDTYVSKATQKAYIEVNEDGSEAAAANAVVVNTLSAVIEPVQPPEFKADRSFLYYILVKGVPLFCGSVLDP